jgi:hypothetical protein
LASSISPSLLKPLTSFRSSGSFCLTARSQILRIAGTTPGICLLLLQEGLLHGLPSHSSSRPGNWIIKLNF